jgi:peptidoglycan/xylan/chitin deacetylase (PgdA/CDA1 family)
VYDWNNHEIWTNRRNWNPQSTSKSITFTFDDGPSAVLNSVLDILNKHDVKAMFFWQSRLFHKKRPWKRVVEEGHIIGGHSLRHRDMTKLSFDEQFHDIRANKEHIEQITGQSMKYFRPPFGQFNKDTLQVLKSLNLIPFLWDVAGLDWEHKNNPHYILHNIYNHAGNGSVILLHELRQTVSILDELITVLKSDGFMFELPPVI